MAALIGPLSGNERRILIAHSDSKDVSEQLMRIFLSVVEGGKICMKRGFIVHTLHWLLL
jgi:hypothetical protein